MELFSKTRRGSCPGFSLVEALIVVVVIAIVASVAIPNIGGVHQRARALKLEKDVDTVNSAIDIYRANGGSLADCKSPVEILSKLKTVRDATTAPGFVGLTGSTIDRRLALRSATDADANQPRAVWNPAESRFQIEARGDGVREFYFDETLAEVDFGEDNRSKSVLEYNTEPGWIWAYNDKLPPPPAGGPTIVPVTAVAESPLPTPRTTPSVLSPPTIAPGGGIFAPGNFPQTVTLTNPNDASTWLLYSVNGAPFVRYTAPFSIPEDSSVKTLAVGDPSQWINSQAVGAWFQAAAPPILSAPAIALSASVFNDDTSSISVTISNPNPSGSSTLRYALIEPGGAAPTQSGWTSYSGPIDVNVTTFPNGFEVVAYAKAVDPEAYIDSGVAENNAGANFIFKDPGTTDVLYIIDVSGSMGEAIGATTRFQIVIDALAEAISRLRPKVRFSVATFAGDIKWADSSLQLKEATNANKQAMLDQIKLFAPDGSGTNYEAALRTPFIFTQKPALVIFLTDGQPTTGSGYNDEVANLAAEGIIVNTIGVDLDDTSEALLGEISSQTGGEVSVIELD